MAPQPLSRKYPKGATPIFAADALYKRPSLAPHVLTVIANASATEAILINLVTSRLQIDHAIVHDLLASVHDTARNSAVKGALEKYLQGDDLHLFRAVTKLTKTVDNHRNEFAHHIWAIANELPNDLLLTDARYLRRFHFDTKGALHLGNKPPEVDLSQVFVFDEKTLDERSAESAYTRYLMDRLYYALRPEEPEHAKARSWLFADPRVQKEVENLRHPK